MDRADYIVSGHAPKGQAITTRYFVKKQNELKSNVSADSQTPKRNNYSVSKQTVLSFVQL
jgi:hypothetical protein